MKPSQLADTLAAAIPSQIPVLVEGSPGIGKTEICEQSGGNLDYKVMTLHPLFFDPIDLGGVPVPRKNGTIKRLPDDFLARLFKPEPQLVIIDELGQADRSMQCACAALILSRRIGGRPISDRVSFVATANRKADRAGSASILTHLLSRVVTVELVVDPTEWLEYAAKVQVLPAVTSFIKANPSLLCDFNAEQNFADQSAYACPRSWMTISRLLQSGLRPQLRAEVFSGTVGPGPAKLFSAHLLLVEKNFDLVAVSKGGPWKFPAEKDLGLRYAFAMGLGSLATVETEDRLLDIACELPTEYGILLLKTAAQYFSEIDFLSLSKTKIGKIILEAKLCK